MADPNVWVVLAAYNEEQSAPAVIERLLSLGYSVVCVDDGSTDDTAHVVGRTGCDLVVHPFNLGQGAALQTGIDHALWRGAEYICTMDSDGQHDPAELPRLLEALDRQAVDFALGSRFRGRTIGMPWTRRLLLSAAIMFTRLTTGLSLTDTHNGMRAMTRRGAACIRLRQDRMAHGSEILTQIRRSGLGMTEVPVTISYTAYSLAKGQRTSSAMRVLGDLAAGLLRR